MTNDKEDSQNCSKSLDASLSLTDLKKSLHDSSKILEEIKAQIIAVRDEVQKAETKFIETSSLHSYKKSDISDQYQEIQKSIKSYEQKALILEAFLSKEESCYKFPLEEASIVNKWHTELWYHDKNSLKSYCIAILPGIDNTVLEDGTMLLVTHNPKSIFDSKFIVLDKNIRQFYDLFNQPVKYLLPGLYPAGQITAQHSIFCMIETLSNVYANTNIFDLIAKDKACKLELQSTISGLKEQEQIKINLEVQLKDCDHILNSAKTSKEKAELKLQELLEQQKTLEEKCAETEISIQSRAASEAEEVKLAEAALRQAMELIKEQGATEESIKDLGMKIEELLKFHFMTYDIELISEAQHLEEKLESELEFNHQQATENEAYDISEDHYVYITGINSYGW